jgi:hypothetical protein
LFCIFVWPVVSFIANSGAKSGMKQYERKKQKLEQLKKIRVETEAAMKEVDEEMAALEDNNKGCRGI